MGLFQQGIANYSIYASKFSSLYWKKIGIYTLLSISKGKGVKSALDS
jgi:hypothetical protein